MPPENPRERLVLIATVGVLALFTVYVVLFLGQVVDGVLWVVGVAIPLVALYLFWRFVRAHERIADALE